MVLFCPRCGSELPAKFRGEWFDSGPTCSECGVAIADPPGMLAPSEAEMTYGLDEWPVADRAAVTASLAADDIPYRWEAGIVLVVPEAVEAVVDAVLDDLEGLTGAGDPAELVSDPDADDALDEEPPDGGVEAHAAMADLFVVADRLHHTPWDADLNAELEALVAVVGSTLPPYGVNPAAWRHIHALALAVGEATDDDTAAESTSALRDYLRHLV